MFLDECLSLWFSSQDLKLNVVQHALFFNVTLPPGKNRGRYLFVSLDHRPNYGFFIALVNFCQIILVWVQFGMIVIGLVSNFFISPMFIPRLAI